MEILKNVILAVHIIGVAALLGGVLYQVGSARRGTPRVLPAMVHGAWTMLVTGIALVGLQYPLGNEVNNVKITVKLVVLIAILVIVLINRKREQVASWVLPAVGILTVINILLATAWK
jgi:high-affinity Fe2+/Pb2+ permease